MLELVVVTPYIVTLVWETDIVAEPGTILMGVTVKVKGFTMPNRYELAVAPPLPISEKGSPGQTEIDDADRLGVNGTLATTTVSEPTQSPFDPVTTNVPPPVAETIAPVAEYAGRIGGSGAIRVQTTLVALELELSINVS